MYGEIRPLQLKKFLKNMFPKHGRGERSCLAVAIVRGAILATDDQLARRTAKLHGIEQWQAIQISKQQLVMIAGLKKQNIARQSYFNYPMSNVTKRQDLYKNLLQAINAVQTIES